METNNIAAMRKALEEIDELTNLLDVPEDPDNPLTPSHSYTALKIRKLARCVLSALGPATTKPKVLVIDDVRYMRSYAQKFLDFCDVEQEYGIPEDEDVLAKYDVLIVDGEGIGNSKYKDGIEFCKAYEKQGNNKGLIYHSGLLPDKGDREELEKKGIKSVLKGGFASDLVEAVQEVVLNPSSGKESK